MNNGQRSPAGVIWIAAAAIMITMLVSGFLLRAGPVGWVLAILTLAFAMMSATAYGSGGPWQNRQAQQPTDEQQSKPKRGDMSADMLALLSDDDIEDLRERIKQRLADQIDTGSLEDMQSFEELLASRDRLKRK